MKNRFIAVIGCLVVLSSCMFLGERVRGNGHIVTRQENVGSFTKVDVGGAVKVHVRQDATPGVRIETDENLMEYLEVHTEGDRLVIGTRKGYNLDPSRDIVAYISAPAFRDIDVSGSCDIIGDNAITGNESLNIEVSGSGDVDMQVDVPKLSSHVSGSGDIALKGKAADFEASVSGSGSIKCMNLVTDNTSLDLSGNADAEVTANKSLDVEVSGSGSVKYKGNAAVKQRISGSGSVEKVG